MKTATKTKKTRIMEWQHNRPLRKVKIMGTMKTNKMVLAKEDASTRIMVPTKNKAAGTAQVKLTKGLTVP